MTPSSHLGVSWLAAPVWLRLVPHASLALHGALDGGLGDDVSLFTAMCRATVYIIL